MLARARLDCALEARSKSWLLYRLGGLAQGAFGQRGWQVQQGCAWRVRDQRLGEAGGAARAVRV